MSSTLVTSMAPGETEGAVGRSEHPAGNNGLPVHLKQRLDRICTDFMESRAGNYIHVFPTHPTVDVEEGASDAQDSLERGQRERLWNAACWRDYQLTVAERSFASETAQIETEFAAEAVQLRDSMLGALVEQRQALQEERERLLALQAAAESSAASTAAAAAAAEETEGQQTNTGRVKRSLRSAAAGGKKEEKAGSSSAAAPSLPIPPGTAAPKRRAQAAGTSILGMSTLLPEHEIYEDLNVISRLAGGDDGTGRRNAARAGAVNKSSSGGGRKRLAVEEEPVAASPAKSTSRRNGPTASAANMKDLSAPADESLSGDEDDDSRSHTSTASSRKRSLGGESEAASTTTTSANGNTVHRRKNSAEDKDISIDPNTGAFYYCGCKYVKGAAFDMAYGRDLSKTFPVTLLSAAGEEIQVKRSSDGSKIKIHLGDLLEGSVMILATQ